MKNSTFWDENPETVDLVMLALKEMSNNKKKKSNIYSIENIKFFIESLISEDDIKLIQYTEKLFNDETEYEIFFEKFIPEVAEDLGNSWKKDELTFVEVSLATSRLQKLCKVFEKKYLGPLFLETLGPDILLILPKNETHSLAPIVASGILKKVGSNPFLAIGYDDKELIELVKNKNFKIIGFSITNSKNISECLKLGRLLKKNVKDDVHFVLGGQGTKNLNNQYGNNFFSLITSNPKEILALIN
tara:strand:- start:939 stop:1673 length:735 start_codon:yes stop_codon:yes gene_type:complete